MNKYGIFLPERLYFSIKEDDPFKGPKLLQIKYWWNANQKFFDMWSGRINLLEEVFSDEDCWKKVGNIHGIKLEYQSVGKKLIEDFGKFFTTLEKYEIACNHCMMDEIRILILKVKEELSIKDMKSFAQDKRLVKYLEGNYLMFYWSHLVSGSLNGNTVNEIGLHKYEFGITAAVNHEQLNAVEFFWNKLTLLPGEELSVHDKDKILTSAMMLVVDEKPNAGYIFDFFFNKVNVERYFELAKGKGVQFVLKSLKILLKAYNFEKFQKLFDCLSSKDITEEDYFKVLRKIDIENYPEFYWDPATKLFLHIWQKDGFDDHRNYVINLNVSDTDKYNLKNLLKRWTKVDIMEPVKAVFEYMN